MSSREELIKRIQKRNKIILYKNFFHEFKIWKGCCLCGYMKSPIALVFHHIDDNKDKKLWKSGGKYKKFYQMEEEWINELSKCILVCSNCHREIHSDEIFEFNVDDLREFLFEPDEINLFKTYLNKSLMGLAFEKSFLQPKKIIILDDD